MRQLTNKKGRQGRQASRGAVCDTVTADTGQENQSQIHGLWLLDVDLLGLSHQTCTKSPKLHISIIASVSIYDCF